MSSPNIIWITIDSLRFDHTTLSGYERDTTPELERISQKNKGVSFEKCYTPGAGTPMSTASFLSGTYPSTHRVGIGEEVGTVADLPTLPESVLSVGYKTIGISENAYAGRATKVDEKFDEFEFVPPQRILKPVDIKSTLKYFSKLHKYSIGFDTEPANHSQLYYTADLAQSKVSRGGDESPILMYIHINEPHHPYLPPKEYAGNYIDDIDATLNDAMHVSKRMHNDFWDIMSGGLSLNDSELESLIALYDSEIKYTDEIVGRLFDRIRGSLDGKTVFVITSDHGELFGEKGLLSHQLVTDSAISHVPLVVYGLESILDMGDQLVQQIDVIKTIMNVLGLDSDKIAGGLDPTKNEREFVVTQNSSISAHNKIGADHPASVCEKDILTSLVMNGFKLEVCEREHVQEFLKLCKLPDEVTDVKEEYPDIFDELVEVYKEFSRETDGLENQKRAPESTKKYLRDMGYLE